MFAWCHVCVVLCLLAKRVVTQGYIMRDELGTDSSLSIVVQ